MAYTGNIHVWKKVKNKILILRHWGGVGDIINTRMIFYDLKKNFPNFEITYAIPENLKSLVIDHPYIDKIIDFSKANLDEYGFYGNISTACGEYESKRVPYVDKHRSDIWANSFGLELTRHEADIRFSSQELKWADKWWKSHSLNHEIVVGLSPISAHPCKNLQKDKVQELIYWLNLYGFRVIIFHNDITDFEMCLKPRLTLREWMVLVNKCDFIITVATSTFCLANALHKPTIAIFGNEDLEIYGKYFPEMFPIQRHRKRNPEWQHCPCWQGLNCKIKKGVYPPPCLQSITVKEILDNVKKLVEKYNI